MWSRPALSSAFNLSSRIRFTVGYVSLSDARSMNGHTQSGGHWNAAFWMMTTGSGDVGTPQWSSRSVDGSANGILYIMESILHNSVAQRPVAAPPIRKRQAMGREPHPVLRFSHNSSTL